MIVTLLVLFIIISIVMFILSVYTMDDYPELTVPLLMVGMIFTVLCAYGMWDVEFMYVGYNSTLGNSTAYFYSTEAYGDPYSYIFLAFFFIYCILFFRVGVNLVKEALKTEGTIDYKGRGGKL